MPGPVFPPPPMIPSTAGGLPAYTVPPATNGNPDVTTPIRVGDAGTNAEPFGASSGHPFGAAPGHPTGAATAQPSTAAAHQAGHTYGAAPSYPPGFDPAPTVAVPRHQLDGTLYGTGGYETIDTTMPVSTNPVETSGSLTGHILAQGWRDEIVDRRRSNLKVAVAMLVVLGLLVLVSVIFLLTAGSSFSEMLGKMFQ